MYAGYQSAFSLDQLIFNGNFPAQHLAGDFGLAQGTNNYTLRLSPALTEYAVGIAIKATFLNSNTGAVTLNIDGLGAVPVRMTGGLEGTIDLLEGEITPGKVYVMVYLNHEFQLINAGQRPDRMTR